MVKIFVQGTSRALKQLSPNTSKTATQKIQGVLRPPFETVITQSCLFVQN